MKLLNQAKFDQKVTINLSRSLFMGIKGFAYSVLSTALIFQLGVAPSLAQSASNITVIAQTTDQEGNEGILFRSSRAPNKVGLKVTLSSGTFDRIPQSATGRSGISGIRYGNGFRLLNLDRTKPNATRTSVTWPNVAAGHKAENIRDLYFRINAYVIGTDGQKRDYSGIFTFDDIDPPFSHRNPVRTSLGIKCSALNMASAKVNLKDPKVEFNPERKEWTFSAIVSGRSVISDSARSRLMEACHIAKRTDCDTFVDQLLQKQLGNVDRCGLKAGFALELRGVHQATATNGYTISPLDSPARTDVQPLMSQSPGGPESRPICGDGLDYLTTYKVKASDVFAPHLFKNGDVTARFIPVSEVRNILRTHGQMWDRFDCTAGDPISAIMKSEQIP